MKYTVSRVFEDLKFKISEGCKQNWSFPVSALNWDSQQGRARKTSILVLAFWNFKLKVLKYPSNCRLHATMILNLMKPLMYIHCMMLTSTYHENHLKSPPTPFQYKRMLCLKWIELCCASLKQLKPWVQDRCLKIRYPRGGGVGVSKLKLKSTAALGWGC